MRFATKRCRLLLAAVGFALALVPLSAAADEGPALRVVVLPRVTLDRQPAEVASLEMAAGRALRDAGLRPISLDASLRSQALALAESVEAGQIPEGITALNADAIWLVRLSCQSTRMQAWGTDETICSCTFDRGVVRDEEEVFSASDPWRGQCLGSEGAMGRLLESTIPEKLAEDVGTWKEIWVSDGTWDVDLLVTGLRDRAHARSLVGRLEALPGVSSVRMGVFSRTASRYSLRGEGREAAFRLAEHIEDDGGFGLAITHQTDRLIHAELDFGRAHRRQSRVLVVPPAGVTPKSRGAMIADAAPDLAGAALANLGWLEPGEIETEASQAARRRVLRAASEAEEPFVAVVTFRTAREPGSGESWLVSASLVASADGGEILSGTGRDEDPLTALDASMRDLDSRFMAAVSEPAQRRRLGLPEAAADDVGGPSLRVTAFELMPLFPTRAREYREDGLGTLRLVNGTGAAIGEGRVEIRAAGMSLASVDLPPLPEEAEAELPVLIESMPELDPDSSHRVQVEATISFRAGQSYGRVRAYAPLLVHRRNALDWNQARSVAAFIDPTDAVVRDLATQALAEGLPEAGTRSLARAALVHAALWQEPLHYVADPVTTAFDESIDDVQHPRQTLERLAGDCDDLTVLLASLYESVGLATAVITTPGHVLPAVEAGLFSGGHVLLGRPKGRFVEVDGALFIPIEATAIGVSFEEAWRLGAEIVENAGETATAFRTRDAWRRYPTMETPAVAESRLETRSPDIAALSEQLPALDIPETAPDDAPLAAPALQWLSGDREDGSIAAADACAEGSAEACYNLAVMLVAEAGGLGAEGEGDAPLPPLLVDALSLLPEPVVRMILDHGGLGMGDDQSEASGEATTRRQLEDVLRKAQERQAALRARGEGGRRVQIDPMGGRRGSPAAEPTALAPMFFFGPAEG